MRIVCPRILAFGAMLLVAAGAQAGAWLEPPGQGEVILGGTFSDSLRSYDVRGRLAPVSSYRKFAVLGSKLTLDRRRPTIGGSSGIGTAQSCLFSTFRRPARRAVAVAPEAFDAAAARLREA
ncbi:MAG: protein XagA [Methylobacteriaceae bacterium]|nr:protein XagA [Methylobacteriaceae bacterium]